MTTDRRRYAKLYRVERDLTGQKRTIPTDQVRAHVLDLRRTMSMSAIAAQAGVGRDVVATALYREHITRRNAKALLTVRAGIPDGARYIDATGTKRRLQGLAALGYSARMIAAAVGVTEKSIHVIRSGASGPRVYSTTARAIADYYDRHSMTPAPSINRTGRATTITVARREGWVPPLAWDDATIDDPDAVPSGAGYKPGYRIDEIRELEALGLTRAGIAARLGVTQNAIDRTIDRANKNQGAAA